MFDAIGMADATFRLSDGNRHRLVTQHRVDDAGLTPLPEHDAAGAPGARFQDAPRPRDACLLAAVLTALQIRYHASRQCFPPGK